MEPLPETRKALRILSATSQVDLLRVIGEYADRVVEALATCVGLSVTLREDELTFTWLATDDHVRRLDAAQFLDGGPCEEAASTGVELSVPDLMDEGRWRLLRLASSALGVQSSLSLPLHGPDGPIGSINLYGRFADTFLGREIQIAKIFGTDIESWVTNADLSMASRARAENATDTIDMIDTISIASGVLAERDQVSIEEAANRMELTAARANLTVLDVAEIIIRSKEDAP